MSKIRLVISVFITSFLFVSTVYSQTESITENDLTYVKTGNGMNALLVYARNTARAELSLYIKTGSMYDPDSVSGISNILQNVIAEKVSSYLRKNSNINFNNSKFTSYSNTEHAVYKFDVATNNIAACFKLMCDSILNCHISESEITRAKQSIREEFVADSMNLHKQFHNKVLRILYRQDFEKLNTLGNSEEFKNIDSKLVSAYQAKYYVPNNAILAAYGSLSYFSFQQMFEAGFSNLIRSEFDPESITKIIDLRPMVYTSQFVMNDENEQPEFQLNWQFPGTSSNQQASYCAYLLSAILNDKNNFIQVKAGKLGCKKLSFEYESNNFNGVLRVIVQPDKAYLQQTIELVSTEMARLEKTLVNESMMNAGKLQFKREYENLKKSKDYAEWIIKYWAYKDESYFPLLADTLMTITERQMRSFVIEYLNQTPHVTGLLISADDRETLKVDSFFTDVDEKVANYKFYYRQNVTELEGNENFTMLNNLLQFLKINKDVNIQVNGYADESEFNQVKDDSVMHFLDSLSGFRRTMPEKIKKGYLKPEMMRAMRIVKFLYEHGIADYRLSGTSMKFTSQSNEQTLENLKCTITIDKLRKAPSAYEFHYGKPKPPKQE